MGSGHTDGYIRHVLQVWDGDELGENKDNGLYTRLHMGPGQK